MTPPVRQRGLDEPPGEFLIAKAKPNGTGPGHPRSRSPPPPPKCNECPHSFAQSPGKNPRHPANAVPNPAPQGPTGRPIPAWGNAPGFHSPVSRRAEGLPHPAAHRGTQSIGLADRKGKPTSPFQPDLEVLLASLRLSTHHAGNPVSTLFRPHLSSPRCRAVVTRLRCRP